MRYSPVSKIKGDDAASKESILGAVVAPGKFTICLTADGKSLEEELIIVKEYGVAAKVIQCHLGDK